MKKLTILYILVISAVITSVFTGCRVTGQSDITNPDTGGGPAGDDRLISDIGGVRNFSTLGLRGFGLVTGLADTGSSDCPSNVKNYLTGYISQQLPAESKVTPAEIIRRADSAAVSVLGLLPAGAVKGERFDLIVSALKETETTSLKGGRLMPAELKQAGSGLLQTKTLAEGEGAVFMPAEGEGLFGYVLNGGRAVEDKKIVFVMNSPDYPLTSRVRDVINSKFGERTAVAVSDRQINLSVPEDYRRRKLEFLKIVNSMRIFPAADRPRRVAELVNRLKAAGGGDRVRLEYRLIAVGKPAAEKLRELLDSRQAKLRLSAARVLLSIGDYAGYEPLAEFAFSDDKDIQLSAIETLAHHGRRKDVSGLLGRLLGDDDLAVKLKAYGHLKRFDDLAIAADTVETRTGNFDLDRVVAGSAPVVWAARSGKPRIVLFSSPIYCDDSIFVQSEDGSLMLTSRSGQKAVTLVRTRPSDGEVIKISCSNELGIVISRMCGVSLKDKNAAERASEPGLGVGYSEMVKFVELMCRKGAVNARFVYGPEPDIKGSIKIGR